MLKFDRLGFYEVTCPNFPQDPPSSFKFERFDQNFGVGGRGCYMFGYMLINFVLATCEITKPLTEDHPNMKIWYIYPEFI